MTEHDTRTFNVLLSRRAMVEMGLQRLAKRAARKDLGTLVWTWGKAYCEAVERVYEPHEPAPPMARLVGRMSDGRGRYSIDIHRIPLTLPHAPLKYAGWRFMATLQHLDGENILRSVPGSDDIPHMYRTRGPMCDHCRTLRRRNDTYVLLHDDGKYVQVGSTCVGDFLGSDDAGKLASMATLLGEAASLASSDESEGSSGTSTAERLLCEYLPYVAWCVREHGWKSRTTAHDVGGQATADEASGYMYDRIAREKVGCEPTSEDIQLAEEAETWAENLPDETVDAERGDYLHNLRAVARTGLISYRTIGIGASMIIAYQRFLGNERKRIERENSPTSDIYIGNVGDKVTFGLPAKRGKSAPIAISDAPVKLDFVTGYETQYGYTTVLKFKTLEGATLVWKASNTEISRSDVGKSYSLSGTIKEHAEYKGNKQTVMSRCKVVEINKP